MRILADRILQTSTTTGTGAVTLAATVAGFQAFSSWMSDGDTCDYVIFAVDGSGVPTGEWETGTGTLASGGTVLQRTSPWDGSATTPVNFSAGTKRVALAGRATTMEIALTTMYNVEETTNARTLTFNDDRSVIDFSYNGAKTLTIPNQSTETFEYGVLVYLSNSGTGALSLSLAGGVTLTGPTTIPSGSMLMLLRLQDNVWRSYLLKVGTQRGAVVKKAADQTAADYSTATAVAWTGEVSDTDTIHDNATNNNRVTVPAGVTQVRLRFNLELANVTADTWVTAKMRKNGAAFDGQGSQSVEIGTTTPCLNASSALLAVTGGDYFDVTLQAEDNSIDVVAAGSWFEMEIVA